MIRRIALAGNPNSGKTSIFNELTGSTQYVGNWPGVTVEKKEGFLKGDRECQIIDLPGIYSLSPYTLEEVVTRDFLLKERPDAIIDIVDATNLERNLYLTTQLMETGVPVVIALNMIDIVHNNGDRIDSQKLSVLLGCPVVETSAVDKTGLKEVVAKAKEIATQKVTEPRYARFSDAAEKAVQGISKLISSLVPTENLRWYAVKLFEKDTKILEKIRLEASTKSTIDQIIANCESELDDVSESIVTKDRYNHITSIIAACVVKKKRQSNLTVSDRIDRVVTNRWAALPIFFLFMWGVYFVAIQSLGDMFIGWVEWIFVDLIGSNVAMGLKAIGTSTWLTGLIVDGIIGGVGAVMTFVPQMMILFFFLALMEDCGYMARVAFIMDRLFRRFGLSGKSFIPMLIGTGCSVPAIMATRTIENQRDRRMTIMLTPFIPCGAKLPVFALFVGAIFPNSSFVGPSMYLLGIAAVIVSGIVLKKTPLFKGDPAPFVMEMPSYHIPRPKGVLIHMWDRGKAFIKKAGTIIALASAVIWVLQSTSWSFQMVEAGQSILASLGRFFAPLFVPLGFGTWEATVAIVTGLLAKETMVATFGILYGLGSVAENDASLLAQIGQLFNPVSAYAFMVFTLFASPCMAAIGATHRELHSTKWTWLTVAYQTGFAYMAALLINQIGRLFL